MLEASRKGKLEAACLHLSLAEKASFEKRSAARKNNPVNGDNIDAAVLAHLENLPPDDESEDEYEDESDDE